MGTTASQRKSCLTTARNLRVDDSEEEEVMLHHVNETEGYHGEESNGGDEEGDDWKEAEAEVMPYHCEESEERDDS